MYLLIDRQLLIVLGLNVSLIHNTRKVLSVSPAVKVVDLTTRHAFTPVVFSKSLSLEKLQWKHSMSRRLVFASPPAVNCTTENFQPGYFRDEKGTTFTKSLFSESSQ